MKTALKKSFVLIGIALFFVLTAWAEQKIWAWDKNVPEKEYCVLTSSLRTPKFFVKEFSYFLMPCHQHGLGVNLLVQR